MVNCGASVTGDTGELYPAAAPLAVNVFSLSRLLDGPTPSPCCRTPAASRLPDGRTTAASKNVASAAVTDPPVPNVASGWPAAVNRSTSPAEAVPVGTSPPAPTPVPPTATSRPAASTVTASNPPAPPTASPPDPNAVSTFPAAVSAVRAVRGPDVCDTVPAATRSPSPRTANAPLRSVANELPPANRAAPPEPNVVSTAPVAVNRTTWSPLVNTRMPPSAATATCSGWATTLGLIAVPLVPNDVSSTPAAEYRWTSTGPEWNDAPESLVPATRTFPVAVLTATASAVPTVACWLSTTPPVPNVPSSEPGAGVAAISTRRSTGSMLAAAARRRGWGTTRCRVPPE